MSLGVVVVPVHYLMSEQGKVSQLSHCSRAPNNPELCGFQIVANISDEFEDYSQRHQFQCGKNTVDARSQDAHP